MKGGLISTQRRYRLVAAFVFVFTLVGGYSWYASLMTQPTQTPPPLPLLVEATSESVILPTHIRIPKLSIDAPFAEPLGIDTNYEIQVPTGYEEVGYYKYGPAPGEIGPAVVLGHVDSYTGPAVFYGLGQLTAGDMIEIDREDGTTAVFAVDYLEHHEQAGFPTEKVYSDINHAGLRLITCSGTFNRGEQRYSHNLIVFGTLVDIRQTD